jgi:LuxR family maltose regulon positive regulatory protein
LHLLDSAAPGLLTGVDVLSAKAIESRGLAALWAGDLTRAGAWLAEVATADTNPVAADARAGLSLLALLRGRPAEAVAHARAASAAGAELDRGSRHQCELVLALGQWLMSAASSSRALEPTIMDDHTGLPSRLMYLAALAQLAAADGDVARARGLLPDPQTTAAAPQLVRDWVALAEAAVHLSAGRPVHALTALSQQSYGRQDPLGAHARVMAARAYLASAAPARAASLLAPIHEWPDVGTWMRVEAWLVSALAADAQGHDGAVTIAFAEALVAAATGGVVAPFLSPSATALLDRHRDLLVAHPDLAARLTPTRVRDRRVRPYSQPVVRNRAPFDRTAWLPEPITTRETVVLRYLPTLLTMNDIARELSVSPNTVKSHLRHIYRKLGVGSRRDAVRQARRLGLLWD